MKSKAKKISSVSESRKAGLTQAQGAPSGAKITSQPLSDATKPVKAAPSPIKW